MSFLNVCGKIYHCIKCNKSIQIEYLPIETKEGLLTNFTQIGDMNIWHWIELNAKYGQPNNTKPNAEEIFYLHEEGICGICVDKILKQNPNMEKNIDICNKINDIYNKISENFENYKENIDEITSKVFEQLIEKINFNICKEVDDENFIKKIGLKIFKLRSKRENLINEFLELSKHKLLKYLQNNILNQNEISDLIKAYKEKTDKLFIEINELLKHKIEKIYISKDVSQPENLNSLISYEMTIRFPVDETKKDNFFFEIEIDKKKIKDSIGELKADKLVDIDEDETIKMIKNKLSKIAEI